MSKELIEVVKNWVILDNQISALSKKMKELKLEKKKHNENMIGIMKENNIDNFDLKDGQIRYKKESRREALTQKKLLNILSKHPQLGEEQANFLNKYVYDSRKVVEKEIVCRKISKEAQTPSDGM